MAHLPLFKLGVLLVKQATKPMARAVKSRAVSSEALSRFCGFLGQTWHVQTTKLNLRVQGHKVKGVKPLNEQEAIQSGAELLAEGFVLSVGISALILESKRSAAAAAEKSLQKAERRRQKMVAMQHLNDTVRDLAQYTIDLRKAIIEADKVRRETEKSKKPVPALTLPHAPVSVMEMIGGTDSPTDIAVAAHNKSLEDSHSWSVGLAKKLSFDSVSSVIRYVGSIVNGEDMDDDDSGGGDDDDDSE